MSQLTAAQIVTIFVFFRPMSFFLIKFYALVPRKGVAAAIYLMH